MTGESEREEKEVEDEALRKLLKRSVGAVGSPQASVVESVQKKIRHRSRGKFFSDGWSTTSFRVHYLLVALVMLLIVAVAYIALGPTGVR